MKILPSKGYVLFQIIKEDFDLIGGKGSKIIRPFQGKDSSFYNRMKIIAIGKVDDNPLDIKPNDIVVITGVGYQVGVPGSIKNSEGKWIETMLAPFNQIMAKIEGDVGEDLTPDEIIMPGKVSVN